MHLTLQKARELPPFIKSPHFDSNEGLLLAESLRMPVLRDAIPVTSFVPGWHPDGLSLLFYPLIILQFRHVDGDFACWFLDNAFNYISSTFGELFLTIKAKVSHRAASIAAFLNGLGTGSLPYYVPDDVTSFLKLAPSIRDEIFSCFKLPTLTDRWDVIVAALASGNGSFTSEVETDMEGRHRFAGSHPRYELLARGEPVVLQSGWHIQRVSSLFFPIFIADLHHDDGRTAYWFFDHHGNFIMDRWDMLPEPAKSIVATYSATILEDLWQDVVASPSDRTRDHVEGFLALPVMTRHGIFDLHHSPPSPEHHSATWILADPLPDITAYVAQTERGPALLDRAQIERALVLNIQGQNIRLINEGVMTWPSPLDGKDLHSEGFALLVDSMCFAYRVQDRGAGLTFYMIALGQHFRLFALYLPENDLLIARDTQHLDSALRYQARYRLLFLRHAVHCGSAILDGLRKPPGPVYHTFRGHPAIQIGHFIWQDLSGVHKLLAGCKTDCLPHFLVPESHLRPEIFGPIDSIFPSLNGLVRRTDEPFHNLVPSLYEENARVVRATAMYVPRAIGVAVLAAYKASPNHHELVEHCRNTKDEHEITVLFGLRVGNRTIINIIDFGIKLITAICKKFSSVAIIIDGQNANDDAVYDCFGDRPAGPGSFLHQELDIAQVLGSHAEALGATLINNIGRPVAESVLWCDAANFFVAPWGAALAKYRWICNKQGLVLTGRWNLQHRSDLSIYHGTAYNEDPAEMWFNALDAVEDIVDPSETNITTLERGNFRVHNHLIEKQLMFLLEKHCKCLDS